VQWRLGTRLSDATQFGPVRIDLSAFGFQAPTPEAYWMMLMIDGLIVYETESKLRNELRTITDIAVAAYMIRQYLKISVRRGMPNPRPVVPYVAETSFLDALELSDFITQQIIGDCVDDTILSPEWYVPELNIDWTIGF
jgi:hypothetical protein